MEIDHSAFGSLMSWMLRFIFQTLKVFLILSNTTIWQNLYME